MKRFLLITMAFPPKGAVGALRTYRLCRYLPELGWLPEVITTHPWGTVNRDCTLLEEIHEDIRIHRTKLIDPVMAWQRRGAAASTGEATVSAAPAAAGPSGTGDAAPSRPSLIGRLKLTLIGLVSTPDHMVFWNLHLLARGWKILRRNRDIAFIITSTPPHSSLIAGTLLGRIFGLPHVLDLRDPWAGRYWGEHSALRRRVERWLQRWVIRRAARVISTTEGYTRMARELFPGCPAEKFVTITNCFEPEKFDRIEPVRRDTFTICYLGIFYPVYEPYAFFTALRLWFERNPGVRSDVELLVVGNCDPATRKVLRENGLEDRLTVTGRIAHERAIAEAKSADLLLLLMGTNDKVPRHWLPAKLFEYLACGKPILAYGRDEEALAIIRDAGAGHPLTSAEPEGFIAVLDREYRVWKSGGREARQDRARGTIETYTSDHTNRQFADLFDDVSADPCS